jgi:RNA polymerase subunit RPABC4/transcription elongation factor Spt4
MFSQCQNNHNKPQMEIAMQRMVEVHYEMMRVLTQDMVNRDSKELPLGMQQVLDDHSRIVQMMSQILASTKNNLSQNNLGSKKPRGDAEITLHACKNCGEIGHTFKEWHEQCPYYDTNHSNQEWPRLLISYAMESIMSPLNVTFTPWCNERINKPKMDYASC